MGEVEGAFSPLSFETGEMLMEAGRMPEAEAAIHAGTTRGIPVVPVVDDPRTLERSDPFAAFLSHVDKVLERSENAGSFDEDDETTTRIDGRIDAEATRIDWEDGTWWTRVPEEEAEEEGAEGE